MESHCVFDSPRVEVTTAGAQPRNPSFEQGAAVGSKTVHRPPGNGTELNAHGSLLMAVGMTYGHRELVILFLVLSSQRREWYRFCHRKGLHVKLDPAKTEGLETSFPYQEPHREFCGVA